MFDPTPALKLLDDLLTRNKGRKRMLLLEMRKNLLVIGYLDNEVHADTVIDKLQLRYLKGTLESNFDFRSFAILKHKLHKKTARNNPFFERYVGWTTEELFNTIYLKIDDLKTIISITPPPQDVDKIARLRNIHKLMTLLLFHLSKKTIKKENEKKRGFKSWLCRIFRGKKRKEGSSQVAL